MGLYLKFSGNGQMFTVLGTHLTLSLAGEKMPRDIQSITIAQPHWAQVPPFPFYVMMVDMFYYWV